MKKLIESLQIFAKYQDLDCPTHCEHDVLMVVGIGKDEVSAEDQEKLKELGRWHWSSEYDSWISYTFGSA